MFKNVVIDKLWKEKIIGPLKSRTQTCKENNRMKSGATINHISKENAQFNGLAHTKHPKYPKSTRASDNGKEPKNKGGF